MGVVLGLSLTTTDVAWVLVDDADGAVVDHDVIDVHDDDQVARAAARGAHAIATNAGYDVRRVRLVWHDDVAAHGRTLRTCLGDMGFDQIDCVPADRAMVVMVRPDLEPALALAYGAALAEMDIEAADVSAAPRGRRRTRVRLAAAVLGAAAAATLGGLLLTSGGLPQIEPTATATVPAVEPGWVAVAVPAPTDGTAAAARRVVEPAGETVTEVAQPVRQIRAVTPAPAAETATGVPHLPEGVPHHSVGSVAAAEMPAPAPPTTVETPAPAAVAAPDPAAAAGQPHLPTVPVAAGPAETADVPTVQLPDTDMTVPVNLFTALP